MARNGEAMRCEEWRGMARRRTWCIAVSVVGLLLQLNCIWESKMVNYREGLVVSCCGTTEFRIDRRETTEKPTGWSVPNSPPVLMLGPPQRLFNNPKTPHFGESKSVQFGPVEPRSHRSIPAQVPPNEGTLGSIESKVSVPGRFPR
jgi:hypothetical protein